MPLTRLLTLSFLCMLTFSACSPGSLPPPKTLDLPTITGTANPAPTLTPTLTATLTSSPSLTPLPAIGVIPSSLHGLNIKIWHAFAGPANDLFTSQVAQFNANNQWDFIVTPTGYGDYTSLFDAVNTTLDSGQPPDLVTALPEQTLAWDADNVVVDLKLYFDDPQWGLDKAQIADFPSIFWAQDNVSGRQLGVPAQRSAHFLFYNLTWAHELGFDSPPATTDEFRQQACAANASFLLDKDVTNDGKGGWVVDTSWQTNYSWLLTFGGGVTVGHDYYFRTDPNLAALQFIKGLSDNHCAWPSETPHESFASRTALFISGDLSELPVEMESMERLKNSDEWTVIPFPSSQGGLLVTYGPSYSVLRSTPERQLAAWLFARWLLQPESQSQWVEMTGLFPLRNSVYDLIGPYRQASPQWDAACSYLSLAQGVPQLASWRKARYLLEDGMKVLFQDNLSVDKLSTVLEEMDSMAKELK